MYLYLRDYVSTIQTKSTNHNNPVTYLSSSLIQSSSLLSHRWWTRRLPYSDGYESWLDSTWQVSMPFLADSTRLGANFLDSKTGKNFFPHQIWTKKKFNNFGHSFWLFSQFDGWSMRAFSVVFVQNLLVNMSFKISIPELSHWFGSGLVPCWLDSARHAISTTPREQSYTVYVILSFFPPRTLFLRGSEKTDLALGRRSWPRPERAGLWASGAPLEASELVHGPLRVDPGGPGQKNPEPKNFCSFCSEFRQLIPSCSLFSYYMATFTSRKYQVKVPPLPWIQNLDFVNWLSWRCLFQSSERM